LEAHTRCVQQIRDLLECVWPAALDAAAEPFWSTTWVAALTVIVDRDDGNLARTRRLGLDRLTRWCAPRSSTGERAKPCLELVWQCLAVCGRELFGGHQPRNVGNPPMSTGRRSPAKWLVGRPLLADVFRCVHCAWTVGAASVHEAQAQLLMSGWIIHTFGSQ
jgi:hypothetical protein